MVTQLPNLIRHPKLENPPAKKVSGCYYLATYTIIPKKNMVIVKGNGANLSI